VYADNNSLVSTDCRGVHPVAQHHLRKVKDRRRPLLSEEDFCRVRCWTEEWERVAARARTRRVSSKTIRRRQVTGI